MNKKQITTLWVGLGVFILSILFAAINAYNSINNANKVEAFLDKLTGTSSFNIESFNYAFRQYLSPIIIIVIIPTIIVCLLVIFSFRDSK